MKEHFDKLNRLSESHGALEPGKGLASGVIAISSRPKFSRSG